MEDMMFVTEDADAALEHALDMQFAIRVGVAQPRAQLLESEGYAEVKQDS
jgi:hypothetical protein